MAVTVILPRSLVSMIAGTVRDDRGRGGTVREAIDRLDERTPGLRNRLVDSGPVLREHINVFVNGEQAALDTVLPPGATVHVIPAVSAAEAQPASPADGRPGRRSARLADPAQLDGQRVERVGALRDRVGRRAGWRRHRSARPR